MKFKIGKTIKKTQYNQKFVVYKDELLERLTKMKGEKTHVINIGKKKKGTTTDHWTSLIIVREHYEKLYPHKFDNIKEMGKFFFLLKLT
jgi:hypothetical protein